MPPFLSTYHLNVNLVSKIMARVQLIQCLSVSDFRDWFLYADAPYKAFGMRLIRIGYFLIRRLACLFVVIVAVFHCRFLSISTKRMALDLCTS